MRLLPLVLIIVSALWLEGAQTAVPVTGMPLGAETISANGSSFCASFSPDGRRLFFLSHAGNITSDQPVGESLQLFVRDLESSNVARVNVLSNRVAADADVTSFSLSSNGQFVVFASEAKDRSLGDTKLGSDVFVYNVVAGTNRLASSDQGGHPMTPGCSWSWCVPVPNGTNPRISASGRWVVFESERTFEISDHSELNTGTDVFRRDMLSNRRELVSRANHFFPMTGNQPSKLGAITPDGQRIAFLSTATDLVQPSDGREHVYLRDMAASNTVRVTVEIPDALTDYHFTNVCLDDSGRFVLYTVEMQERGAGLYVRDLEAPVPTLIVSNHWENSLSPLTRPQISSDGRYVLYQVGTNLFRFDRLAGTNEIVTVATNGLPIAAGGARDGVMTPDGNGIVFNSNSPDLTTNGAVGWHLYARDMAAGTARLITVATNGLPSLPARAPVQFAISPELSRVAFDSTASDLVHGDNNGLSDVFLRNLNSGTTELVSRRVPERARFTGSGHAFIGPASLSADGRYAVFSSYDNDFLPGDTNARPDVFIRDLATGVLTTPGLSTNAARFPSISADGRYVVYVRRNAFSIADQGGSIFRYDRETGSEVLVQPAVSTDRFIPPSISGDGRLVAFHSNGVLRLHDVEAGTNEVIAPTAATRGRAAEFSPDSRFVLFESTAVLVTNSLGFSAKLYAWDRSERSFLLLAENDFSSTRIQFSVSGNSRFAAATQPHDESLILHDLVARTNQVVSRYVTMAAINRDGTAMAVLRQHFSPASLFLTNLVTGEEAAIAPLGWFPAEPPLLSGDGRFVLYRGFTNLGDASEWFEEPLYAINLSVRDTLLGTTLSLTPFVSNNEAGPDIRMTQMSADGRTLLFHSPCSQLVPGDYNDKFDIFSVTLARDTDSDGLDDEWEAAYFEDLSRDGTGDHDADGERDRDEFLAGTDPTDEESVFRVLAVTSLGNGQRHVRWSGNPERSYRVEFKDDLSYAFWTALDGTISWNGSVASITDTVPSAANRFYRAVRLP